VAEPCYQLIFTWSIVRVHLETNLFMAGQTFGHGGGRCYEEACGVLRAASVCDFTINLSVRQTEVRMACATIRHNGRPTRLLRRFFYRISHEWRVSSIVGFGLECAFGLDSVARVNDWFPFS